jgi:Family of unknown function (DUF6445)
MAPTDMRLSGSIEVKVEVVAGKFPVVLIDGFYANPDAVREFALAQRYGHQQGLYPGTHEFLYEGQTPRNEHERQVLDARSLVCKVLKDLSGLPLEVSDLRTDFSLVTTPARRLNKFQKHPHFDETPLLGLVYLNDPSMGGTVIYRNKRLGLVGLLTAEHRQAYERWLKESAPDPQIDSYVLDDPENWQPVFEIEGRYNRFAAYPGFILHWPKCTSVPEPFDPRRARLTQRFLFRKIGPGAGRPAS